MTTASLCETGNAGFVRTCRIRSSWQGSLHQSTCRIFGSSLITLSIQGLDICIKQVPLQTEVRHQYTERRKGLRVWELPRAKQDKLFQIRKGRCNLIVLVDLYWFLWWAMIAPIKAGWLTQHHSPMLGVRFQRITNDKPRQHRTSNT